MRKFTRQWTIADDVVVKSAKLENGLLTISLEKIVPDGKKKKIRMIRAIKLILKKI